MFRFEDVLMDDEVILYEGTPVPGKGSKSITGELLVLGFCAFVTALLVFGIARDWEESGVLAIIPTLPFFVAVGIFVAVCGYSIFNKKYKRDRDVLDDFYCITNQRLLKYESKKDALIYGNIANFDHMEVYDEKDGYGSITFYQSVSDGATEKEQVAYLVKMKSQDASDRLLIGFECIRDPKAVLKIAKEARNKAKEQVTMHV